MQIGFIGLGNMGHGMAANILHFANNKGHEFSVFDIDTAAMGPLVTAGAYGAASIADIAKRSDVLFTSLPSSTEVNIVALGPEGILQNLPSSAVWFETSTSELAQWKIVLEQVPDNITVVDAPVTGGTEGAANGTLTMLLGYTGPLSLAHENLLSHITNKVVSMGGPGAGYVAKLCQLHLNYLVAQGIGESLMLGAKGGLDLDVLSDVLSHSCAQSYVVDNYIPMVLDGSYDPSFTLGLATKDMRLISELGNHLDVALPLGDSVYETYQTASETFGLSEPHLKIVKLLETTNHQELRSPSKTSSGRK